MARTTSTQVQTVITLDSRFDMDTAIETATELVTEKCTGDEGPDTAYSDARLELIERWLAAHFYAVQVSVVASEQADVVSESVQYKVDLGLDFTKYGQQAKRLDTNGALARMDEQQKKGQTGKPSVGHMGQTRAEYEANN